MRTQRRLSDSERAERRERDRERLKQAAEQLLSAKAGWGRRRSRRRAADRLPQMSLPFDRLLKDGYEITVEVEGPRP
jgi:hypothetical protein